MTARTLTQGEVLEGPLTRDVVVGVRARALRRGVWFRVLDRVERGLCAMPRMSSKRAGPGR